MKIAINPHRMRAACGSGAVGLTGHARMRLLSFLSKRRRASRPEPSVGQLSSHKPDDSSLSEAIRLAQQGDGSAFELIYQLHCKRVYALCLRMLRDPVEAEDLTQEAFIQVFRKIHTFRGESAFSSWLHRLTANIVLMHFRKKKLMSTSLDEITTNDQENSGPHNEFGVPDLRLNGLFDRINLQTAIDQLPPGYKAMFLLHDVQGYDHHEIAEILGCSIGTSKSQLHKARKRMRELLLRVQHYGVRQNRGPARHSLALAGSH